ncbi:MAG: hypothetical protein IJC25_05475 [Clostridia bacterium]|nr:hypothetical protein [Clostridia bacterium]
MSFINNIANEYSYIAKIRENVYKRKVEIIKTPMVQEIVKTVFPDNTPPKSITVNREGIFARIYDPKSNTYHPNGVSVYSPDVIFDYEFAAAICLLFQDLYPNVYEINHYTLQQLSAALDDGTWSHTLTMHDHCLFQQLSPSFDISNISNAPAETLPIALTDKYTESASKAPKTAFILGICAIVSSVLMPLISVITALIGIVFGIIGLRTNKNKTPRKKAIWGLMFSAIALLIPYLFTYLKIMFSLF